MLNQYGRPWAAIVHDLICWLLVQFSQGDSMMTLVRSSTSKQYHTEKHHTHHPLVNVCSVLRERAYLKLGKDSFSLGPFQPFAASGRSREHTGS